MLRYPGSKAKLARHIVGAFPPEAQYELFGSSLSCYCEPFVGTGAIAWSVLNEIANKRLSVVFNDADPGIAAMWKAVRDAPEELVARILAFRPTREAFYEFKASDGDLSLDVVERGFRKIALHRTSYSGLGYMAGGPLGGKSGSSEYNPECRFPHLKIASKIRKWGRLLGRLASFDVRNQDFECVLRQLGGDTFVYLDPPYYVQGAALYRYSMDDAGHARLALVLRDARYKWVLSYDDHPRVRELYSWAVIGSFEMTPTVQTARAPKRRKNREFLIRSREAYDDPA